MDYDSGSSLLLIVRDSAIPIRTWQWNLLIIGFVKFEKCEVIQTGSLAIGWGICGGVWAVARETTLLRLLDCSLVEGNRRYSASKMVVKDNLDIIEY